MTAPRLLAALVLLIPLAIGCPQDFSEPTEIADDLAGWMTSIKKWEPDEKKVFDTIGTVGKAQFVEDDYTSRSLKEVLPIVRAHIRDMQAFQPKTEEMGKIVRLYRKGWEDLELSFHAIISAAEAKDYIRLAKARDQMEFARGEVLGAYAELDALLENNDVQLRQLRRREQQKKEAEAAAAKGAADAPAAEPEPGS